MTPCLRPDEFVAVLDGDPVPAARRAHLAECETCRAASAALAATLADLCRTEVPEPPPFFWAGMQARLRAAVRTVPPSRVAATGVAAWWRWNTVVPLAGMAAVIMALAVAIARAPIGGPIPAGSAAVISGTAIDIEAVDAGDDALALVFDLAGSLPDMADDALGVVTVPDLGVVASSSLSEIEQEALAEILRTAVDRPKS